MATDAPSPAVGTGLSLLQLLEATITARRAMLVSTAAGFAAFALFAQFRPVRYVATVTVMAAVPGGSESRLAGLASQFGFGEIGGLGGGLTASPDLIVRLARSSTILGELLDDSVRAAATGAPVPILEVVRAVATPPVPGTREAAIRREKGVIELRKRIAVTKNKTTNSATISVTAKSPATAHGILLSLHRRLDGRFTDIGHRQAAEERRFIAARLEEREQALAAAEARMVAFLTANREYRSSAPLVFEHDRLQRVVIREQQVVQALAQAVEDAAVRAARDTPALLVLENAEPPVLPRPRRRVLMALLGCVAGASVGLLLVVTREFARELDRQGSPEWLRLRRAFVKANTTTGPAPGA